MCVSVCVSVGVSLCVCECISLLNQISKFIQQYLSLTISQLFQRNMFFSHDSESSSYYVFPE